MDTLEKEGFLVRESKTQHEEIKLDRDFNLLTENNISKIFYKCKGVVIE